MFMTCSWPCAAHADGVCADTPRGGHDAVQNNFAEVFQWHD